MFTGIITELGRVAAINSGSVPAGTAMTLELDAPATAADTEVGGSVAVNGVCLTAARVQGAAMTFDISAETAGRSNLGALRPGDRVNLELPLTPSSRLGGHLVTGHVDATAVLLRVERRGDGVEWRVRAPSDRLRYVVEKGSVTLDGVSLTAYGVDREGFSVSLIPHTLRTTHFSTAKPGTRLNLEVDILAKYVEKLRLADKAADSGGLTLEALNRAGFI